LVRTAARIVLGDGLVRHGQELDAAWLGELRALEGVDVP
jgi:hypothetical protein